jgi:uncharacterized protein YgbK (DUF1537 family)
MTISLFSQEIEMPIQLQEILSSLPPIWPENLLPAIQHETAQNPASVVVLDDDPTGTQTVHDIPILTSWDLQSIIDEFKRRTPLFYLLTNSRSISCARAVNLAVEIGENILEASHKTGQAFDIISRSDSTLRGHFPAEVDALAEVLGTEQAVYIIAPFFEEGGRYTINNIHYVRDGQLLIPAADTDYAKDVVFGYRNSNLKFWVEEKTRGRISGTSVKSLSLEEIRQEGPDYIADKLTEYEPGSVCIVNAADYRDLEVATLGLLRARHKGQRFLYRTAASFVRVRAGIKDRPLLTADEISDSTHNGGLVVAGSHVPRSSQQLDYLLEHGNVQSIEVSVDKILLRQNREAEIHRSIDFVDNSLSRRRNVVVYTSRKLITGQDQESSLSIGAQISRALVEIVCSLNVRPRYILAKGGITSSDIATQALGIVRAKVLGQILPGVPVWQSGSESKFPDMPYIVFPGNVGSTSAILDVVRSFKRTQNQ